MPSKQHLHVSNEDTSADVHQRLIRMLDAVHELSDAHRSAIETVIRGAVRHFEVGEDIVREHAAPSATSVVLEGFCARYKTLPDGSRQILSFHIPGDAPDLQSLYLKKMDHSLTALGDAVIFQIPHENMFELFDAQPELTGAFWHATLVEASIFREWITNIGQREAYGRIAHLLCELVTRMRAVGLVDDSACRFPITQADIGDATGLSVVHVNRSLQDLRANKLIAWKSGLLSVLDWEGLVRAGEFDPSYLHLRKRPASA